jgi:TolB-like protein
MNFFAELKRRHIYRVAAAYAVVAWVLLQLFNNVEPILKLPDWAGALVLVLLLGGFPVALLLAWIHQLAPADGAAARATATKLDWALIGALVVVIALVSYQQLAPSSGARTAQQAGIALTSSHPQAGSISIAVLPFANVSGDATQEFFSDGMTDEIIGALAKIPSLQVVARTSAYQFKGEKKDMRAIGHALSARYLIDGSVRKAGNRVRITAQLVQADNGVGVWTNSYDRELTDVFAIQEDIAQAIASALRAPLGLQQGDTLVRDRTKNLESYDQYLRAKGLVRTRGQKPVADAIALLEPDVARDPDFAPAWGLLAQAYVLVPANSFEPRSGSVEEERRFLESSLDKAEKAAREAIRLDSRNALAYGARARAQQYRGKWAEAEDLYKQALALDPGEPDVLDNYLITLGEAGRLREALSIAEKLRTLEPFVPAYTINVANYMQLNGQIAASVPILEALPPNAAGGVSRNSDLALAYAAEGRYAQAADTLLLITGNIVSRRSVEDAARLLRSAPSTVKSPESLPALEGPLAFVYSYVGALSRLMEPNEHGLEIGYNVGAVGQIPPRP